MSKTGHGKPARHDAESVFAWSPLQKPFGAPSASRLAFAKPPVLLQPVPRGGRRQSTALAHDLLFERPRTKPATTTVFWIGFIRIQMESGDAGSEAAARRQSAQEAGPPFGVE